MAGCVAPALDPVSVWQVSSLLMKKLGLEIPQFRLQRMLVVKTDREKTASEVEVRLYLSHLLCVCVCVCVSSGDSDWG